MKRIFKKRRGFTLLEMVAVIFVIALLIILFLPSLTSSRNSADKKASEAFVNTVQTQVDLYVDKKVDAGAQLQDIQVDFKAMQTEGYLTAKQLAKINNAKITIDDNEQVHAPGLDNDNGAA
ncbi:late competence protein ComGC [Agrilactobacillus composti DSM 18527 = JCM 14202]|nr:prepilin-type N-terminal cleavage/methylation domain-containing protein [Agrilactobacillus composti]GAF40229.1 late competence protein ComGC [Agrilactobacillus composti DSM 18527 = JCM 14202]